MYRPAGTYFVTADTAPLGYDDGIGPVPWPSPRSRVSWPCRSGCSTTTPRPAASLVRFAVCKRPEVLAEAARRLRALRR